MSLHLDRFACRRLLLLCGALLLLASGPGAAQSPSSEPPTEQRPEVATEGKYTIEEIGAAAEGFFGDTSEGLAQAIQKAFEDQGQPDGYIVGEEISGAFFVGLRYGDGKLNRKTGEPMVVYWQGPSIGWDLGGNASKVFTLVYNMTDSEQIYQRFPGVDGSIYVVAGFGMNYQQQGDVILAPIRTGIGLRLGANVGWLHYTRERQWVPL